MQIIVPLFLRTMDLQGGDDRLLHQEAALRPHLPQELSEILVRMDKRFVTSNPLLIGISKDLSKSWLIQKKCQNLG